MGSHLVRRLLGEGQAAVMGYEKIANNFEIPRPSWSEGLADAVNSLSNGGR